jgi:hypothetical protein
MLDWDLVQDRIEDAKGIAFDTCHKIYVLMDDAQMAQMKNYGYGDEPDTDCLIYATEMSASEMFDKVKKWYDQSCGLRFVEAVSTVDGDPNDGFETLIGQGDTDEEECEDCLELGCSGDCYYEACERCGDRDVYDEDLCRLCYEDSQEDED